MKIRLTATLAAIMCVGTTALAAGFSVEDGTRQVTVTESVSPGTTAVLMVMRGGAELNDDSALFAMKSTVADENGKAVWSFGMPEKINDALTDGECDLYIKENGMTVKTDKAFYATLESRTRVSEGIKAAASEEDIKSVLDSEENKDTLLFYGLRMEEYPASQGDSIAHMIYEEIGDFSSADLNDIKDAFNISVAAVKITTDTAEKNLIIADIEFEETSFAEIEDENLKKWLSEKMGTKDCSSVAAFRKEYQTANILYVINNTRIQYLESNLGKYAADLEISNNDTYKKYTAIEDKTDANLRILQSLAANPADDVNELVSVIKASMSTGVVNGGGSSSGGTGGGSSSGIGKSTSSPGIPSYVPSTAPAQAEKENVGFADMDKAEWARTVVEKMAEAGIVSGDENGNFRPDDLMTREEFVTMIVRALDLYDENAECGFSDTSADKWHYKYIASAYNNEIVRGISDELFGTGRQLTRQDMAAICKRAFDKTEKTAENTEKPLFADDDMIADYAKDSVYDLYSIGAISGMGDNTFSPLSAATRAQGAMIVYNLFVKQ